jgi:D-glycero-D-manno-heptose 1,7-bisphosphate phosphatase
MRRAVFLDRDGVLNRAMVRDGRPYPPRNAAELELLPGVPEACHALRSAGFLLIVVTNQPDVARGTLTREAVEEIDCAIEEKIELDGFYVCYHTDGDGCDCRKPLPGMLVRAAHDFDIDLAASYMVGDRWRDVEAGANAGCTTILVDYGYAEKVNCAPSHCVKSLGEAAEWILQERGKTVKETGD